MPANPSMIAAATESVQRMQEFDVNTLPRTEELGKRMNFADAVEPAKELVALYQKINLSMLIAMPQSAVDNIRNIADSNYNCLRRILNFDPQHSDESQRQLLVRGVHDAYGQAFNILALPICFGVSVFEAGDIDALKNEVRGALQGIENTVSKKTKEAIEKIGEDAAQIIEKAKEAEQKASAVVGIAREAAAATGVLQNEEVFHKEANRHRKNANWWLGFAIVSVVAFVVVAGYDLLWKFFFPADSGIGDIPFFSARWVFLPAIVYALFFCVKNYTTSRHNFVVNTHRQNALQTYQVLVASATTPEVQDIVLTHAARCIFDQRDTGYAKGGGNESGNVVSFSQMEAARKVVKLGDGD